MPLPRHRRGTASTGALPPVVKYNIHDEREAIMSKVSLNVQKQFCEECSLALRRFIGGMEGVESIEVQNGKIEIDYDSTKIAEDILKKLSKDSIEKLGYKLLDE
jgi:copper chaperone CopZ